MSSENSTHPGNRPTVLADRIGRWLLVLAAVATIGAFANGVAIMSDAADDRIFVEAWRTSAYLVFAGLFVILALAPRARPGVWELVIAQKAALVVFAVAVGDVPEARAAGWVDFVLVMIVISAYVLCRGWYGWGTKTAELVARPADGFRQQKLPRRRARRPTTNPRVPS